MAARLTLRVHASLQPIEDNMTEELQPSDYLRKAKALIDHPDNWIKGKYAVNSDGITVHYQDVNACCFCTEGAVYRVTPKHMALRVMDHLVFAVLRFGLFNAPYKLENVSRFNDHFKTNHADIMEIFDDAIQQAEEAEKLARRK